MKKSIIIFAKGPSVLKCTRELVETHEDIAICNYPVLNDFFYNLIKERKINYHFANCSTFDKRYTDDINNKLKIEKIYNTNTGINHYKSFLKNNDIFSEKSLYEEIGTNYFQKKFNFKPSTGIMMIKYLLDLKLYNKITLVGFDNWKIGEQEYYYNTEEYNKDILYLIGRVYNKKGIRTKESEHSSKKSREYLKNLRNKYPDIEFKFVTNDKELI